MNRYWVILLALFTCVYSYATHNRAGEIRYRQLNDLTIIAELITYTKTSSIAADRDSIVFDWGDGTNSNVSRDNGKGFILPNDTKMNIYEMSHTYPGRGEYIISVFDPNRVENILNIDPPNSVNIPFFIQTTIKLFNINFQGINHSPILTNPPIDIACLHQTFVHNPGAFDLDGDSITYSLIVPLMDVGAQVPNYLFPNQIRPGLNNNISFDTRNGTFVWDAPQQEGEYNIAIAINEYRKGQLISSTIRDMQILVIADCIKNNPPTISNVKDTCIIAGDQINTIFIIDDPDRLQRGGMVKVEAFGAPFIIPPVSTTSGNKKFEPTPYPYQFIWNTDCAHVRNEYYTLIIKATDNFYDSTGLSTTNLYRIKVLGPAPENLQSTSSQSNILLEWDYPYSCDSIDSPFKGFSVWRRESIGPNIDTCTPGLEYYGYQRINYLTNQKLNNKYYYLDTTAGRNKNYCYRVQAEFASVSSGGFLYNFTPSLPSNETCNNVKTNEPLLLNVDVISTSANLGDIFVKYHKPIIPYFDTTILKPPYLVKILHSVNAGQFNEIVPQTKSFGSYNAWTDTSFVHSSLNTLDGNHAYRIQIQALNSNEIVSESASQIFLNAFNAPSAIRLQWEVDVPWENYHYSIYRKANNSLVFDSIGQTTLNSYLDYKIEIDSAYCYYIKGLGQYYNNDIEFPLINRSNQRCIKALDSTPPCCPILSIDGPCELGDSTEFLIIHLKYKEDSCQSRDLAYFNLYRIQGDLVELIVEKIDKNSQEIKVPYNSASHSAYLIEAINLRGNSCRTPTAVSVLCPEYVLPNTFTPNGDQYNDVFKPITKRQISNVDFKVINRWGNTVFKTSDPELNWDGTNQQGIKVSDGTYYYSCLVNYFDQRKPVMLNGFIEVFSGD